MSGSMDKKKMLSRSGTGRSAFVSVLAALLCILIGLVCGYLVLLAINAEHAWADGFVRILKGGFYDAPYGVGRTLANAAPLVMTGLSVAFAFKTGLFNIGAAGQYTLGAYGALYCAIVLHLPWYVGLIASAVLGGLWGAIPGLFKAYLNINEVITSIMFNWIGLYLVNEIIYGNGTGVMYDSRNTRTWNLRRMEGAEGVTIPDFGLNDMFQTNSTTIAIFLSIVVAILIWVILDKTTFGYELKAVGLNKHAARYAGINEKKNLVLSMVIAGVEPPELHHPAGHGLQRHFGGPAGQLQPHRHHLLGPVHLPHHGGRLVPLYPVLPHRGGRPYQRHHHLPVRLLDAVPRQDRKAPQRRQTGGQVRRKGGLICCYSSNIPCCTASS